MVVQNGIDETREVLKRIVLMLLSLAGLAEQAATAPYPTRARALHILHNGELAALRLLMDIPSTHYLNLAALGQETPEDAGLMAARLRMLGWIVAFLENVFGSSSVRKDLSVSALRSLQRTLPGRSGLAHPSPYRDTS